VNAGEVREKYELVDKKVVVYVGEMSEWHGADMLLDIAERLKEGVKFLLLGKQLEKLRGDAEARGVADKFVFVGFVRHEEMPEFISAADVGIAPYKPSEEMKKHGFYFSPIKIFEYMACGKAIVVSDLEIIRDVVLENKCGLLVKPRDVEDFAALIRILLGLRKSLYRDEENNTVRALK